ncbi:hypothetical protein K466DRAFT_402891 [Polyporus arcularius HHB13444]|uniref:Uncharacterized protein n=1 Tax=Polyporus arcularius HHB13444 TaxID=1314778 RepID=A0A5C3NRI6_9APHY|nr:hypothetical protein K466DRAFT_402891 [Polyporus arcularius HHB13444]
MHDSKPNFVISKLPGKCIALAEDADIEFHNGSKHHIVDPDMLRSRARRIKRRTYHVWVDFVERGGTSLQSSSGSFTFPQVATGTIGWRTDEEDSGYGSPAGSFTTEVSPLPQTPPLSAGIANTPGGPGLFPRRAAELADRFIGSVVRPEPLVLDGDAAGIADNALVQCGQQRQGIEDE